MLGLITVIKIAPSILSADFTCLGQEIESIHEADYLHFDVMDGLFVPNISVGLPVLESVRKFTTMTLDVHLMITEPLRYVKNFADAGADIIVLHTEADTADNITKALGLIKGCGKKAGLSVKPKTSWEAFLPYINQLDMALVMTVEPGFGGQKFMADQLDKIRALRSHIDKNSLACEIEVDGGINSDTAALCINAGADVLVAGSAVFGAADRSTVIRSLRRT